MSKAIHCELCGRSINHLTRHHLIPRTRHANKRAQRTFDRAELKGRVAWFCQPCHDHIHSLVTEKDLERKYNTIASLAAHPEVAKFVAWIRNKPDGFRPPAKDARSKTSRPAPEK